MAGELHQVPPTLSDVDFASPTTGWVTANEGESGQILGTTDSGRSWRSEWTGPGLPSQVQGGAGGDVWALVQNGFGCGSSAGSTCVPELLASSNSGRSWSQKGSFPAGNVVQIAFSKPSLGVAADISQCSGQLSSSGQASYPPPSCPGDVLLSSDDGAHWKASLKTSGPVFAVAQSSGTLWAVEGSLGGFPGADGTGTLSIIKSVNLGHTWSTVGSLPPMLVTPALTANLVVGTHDRLWLSLFDVDGCAMQGCGATVWLSQDRGRQWSDDTPATAVACSDSAPAAVLSEDPVGNVWDTFNFEMGGCPPPASVLDNMAATSPATWHPVLSWSQFSPLAMSWPSSAVGYAVSSTSLLRTSDGGAHWTQVLPGAVPTVSVDALSDRIAFGAGQASSAGVVSETRNGGETWKVQGKVPGTVTGLDFINSRRGYAATTDLSTETWRLYATNNGGVSWAEAGPVQYTGAPVFGPWMSKDGQGVLVASFYPTAAQAGEASPAAFVWHTNDGGRQWTEGAPVGVGSPLDAVLAASFLPSDLDLGVVSLIEGPKVLRLESTSDGGTHWRPLPTGLQLESLTWSGPDALLGWTPYGGPVATSADLWSSSDGGRHWVPCASPPEPAGDEVMASASLSAVNGREAWFLDADDGALWRTDDLGRSWTQAGLSDIP